MSDLKDIIEKIRATILPKFLLEAAFGVYPKDALDSKMVPRGQGREALIERAISLSSQGYASNEILGVLWIFNQQRLCEFDRYPEEGLFELVNHSIKEGRKQKSLERDQFIFGDFQLSPATRTLFYKNRMLTELTERQVYLIKLLTVFWEKENARAPVSTLRDSLFKWITEECGNDKFEPKTNRLRDWIFRSGGSGDKLWGTLIRSTGGRDARVFLDLSWIPSKDDFLGE